MGHRHDMILYSSGVPSNGSRCRHKTAGQTAYRERREPFEVMPGPGLSLGPLIRMPARCDISRMGSWVGTS